MHPPERAITLALLSVLLLTCSLLPAAEVMPPKPVAYFNDYANVVSSEAASRFNEQLAQFERDTSNQVVVAVFRKMQSDSSIDDYAQRIAQSWQVGQKDRRNGVVLLVFLDDRKISIQVGYGLEGALPDAIAYDIRQNQITPHFRNNDYEGGLATGIDSICQALQGEYKGSGRTVKEGERKQNNPAPIFIFLIIFAFLAIRIARANRRQGYRYSGFGGPFVGGWSGGPGGGGWSSGGGGGGFSGGGGSFGGGGSSGGW